MFMALVSARWEGSTMLSPIRMKKTILFNLAFISLFIGSINAQVYQEFPNIDGHWKVRYSDVWCLDIHYTNPVCSEYQYILSGDTTINAVPYHKINYSGRDRNPVNETWTYWNNGYYGCYRNDAANKKVFFIPKDSTSEQLLYDFDLNLNDTLPESLVYNRSEHGIIKVDQIDSVLVSNTYLKRYHLDNAGFGDEYLIEGIGSTLGLFSPIVPFFEQDYILLCFKNEAEDLHYFSEYTSDCELITGIDDNYTTEPRITISPNPASTAITISLPSTTTFDNTTLSVYNVNAQEVISQSLTSSQTVIDINTLPRGVYFACITTDRTVMVSKFIKQ
jgi:hypothetical protein